MEHITSAEAPAVRVRGLRKDYGDNYYAAFVIDPDGYRLEAYCGSAT